MLLARSQKLHLASKINFSLASKNKTTKERKFSHYVTCSAFNTYCEKYTFDEKFKELTIQQNIFQKYVEVHETRISRFFALIDFSGPFDTWYPLKGHVNLNKPANFSSRFVSVCLTF